MPGPYKQNEEFDYQTANAIDNLRFAADICARGNLTMVLEPLNPWANHPGMFLSKIPHAYLVCRAVDHPNCKILNDLYHQQITEGNLIPNIDMAWSEIAYFQYGDNPGRKEPGTGELLALIELGAPCQRNHENGAGGSDQETGFDANTGGHLSPEQTAARHGPEENR